LSFFQYKQTIDKKTSGDMTGCVHRAVVYSSDYIAMPTALGRVDGIVVDVHAASSSFCEIAIQPGDIVRIYASESIAVGDQLVVTASGEAAVYTPGSGTSVFRIGMAESAAVAGQVISMRIAFDRDAA